MSRKRRKQEESSGGGDDWLATYADLVTLLLCFFVLLFASSTLDVEKFEAFISSFQGGAGVMPGGDQMDTLPTLSGDEEESDEDLEDLSTIKDLIDAYSEEQGMDSEIETIIDERGLVIRSLDYVFFDSGATEIKPEARSILDFIAGIINEEDFSDRQLRIEGHTDSDPITNLSNKYPQNWTNWELSSIRATNVLRYLVETQGISGNRVSTSGYGDERPIVLNDTRENKAINRRVDLIILRSSFSDMEPESEVEAESE